MTYGDVFELHGQKWECLQDYGNGRVLATAADPGSIRQAFVVDVCVNKETGETVRAIGE